MIKLFCNKLNVINLDACDTHGVTSLRGNELKELGRGFLNVTPTKSDDILFLWRKKPQGDIRGIKIKIDTHRPSIWDLTPCTSSEIRYSELWLFHGQCRETAMTYRIWRPDNDAFDAIISHFQVRNWRHFWLMSRDISFCFSRLTGRGNRHYIEYDKGTWFFHDKKPSAEEYI